MGPIGIPELLIILVIVVVLFGATRLPQIGKGLGEGIRNFKKGIRNDDGAGRIEDHKDSPDHATHG